MNQREKKIALLAYEAGVIAERERATHEVRRKTDTPASMAMSWAGCGHVNGLWDKLESDV